MLSTYELLIEEDDPAMKRVVPLDRPAISIGRKPGNSILLGERNVSRHHARLVREGDAVEIEDLNSYTGVLLNGQRISGRAPLQEGDRVQIGDYRLALRRVVPLVVAAPPQTVVRSRPEPRQPREAPVREPPSLRRTRRIVLTLTMAAVGLLGGLLLIRQGPTPQRPATAVSAPVRLPPREKPQPQPQPLLQVRATPPAASELAQARPQPDASPKLRKRSAPPRDRSIGLATATPTATTAPTVVTTPDPPSAAGEVRLEEAQAHYVRGEFAAAIRVARTLTTHPEPGVSLTRAWRLLGAAACRLGDLELLNEAYRRVDPVSRQYLQYVCEQAHVTRSGGRFVLAR